MAPGARYILHHGRVDSHSIGHCSYCSVGPSHQRQTIGVETYSEESRNRHAHTGSAHDLLYRLSYITKEKIVDPGGLEIAKDNHRNVYWQPYVGIVTMVIGGAVLILGRKKSLIN